MPFEASLIWRSPHASHCDRLLVADGAMQADGRWMRAAEQARSQGECELDAAPWLQPAQQASVELADRQFRLPTRPVAGRFYPRMAFASLAQSPRDMRPTRVLAAGNDVLKLDPNHPLAEFGPKLVFRVSAREATRGVRMVELFDGPGMQTPSADADVTYFQPAGLTRQDMTPDAEFYARPRLTHHLDAACRAQIGELYARFLCPGQQVLDLMSSWVSHLPPMSDAASAPMQVAGLGMNQAELDANPALSQRVVQDLNLCPELPWHAAQFDVVVCTASIEYLLNPVAVIAEIRRVLKPGGKFVVTFSDRWFPGKAIQVWGDLHPFERLGMVLALLRDARFIDLHSETLRGLKRPEDDKYIEQRLYSDPLFAAWGSVPV